MIDLALLQTPPWGIDNPPLGLAYLSGYLRHRGYSTALFDLNMELHNGHDDKIIWAFEKKDEWSDHRSFGRIWTGLQGQVDALVKKVCAQEPRVIGLSVNQNSILFALALAERIKRRCPAFVIAGGWGCYNAHERQVLRGGTVFDGFVIGEGEETLREVIEGVRISKELPRVPGFLHSGDTDSVFQARAVIRDLDSIPFPTFEEFDLEGYTSRVLCVLSSRGCIGRCVFCNDRNYQGVIRYRSPEKIVEELDYHVSHNGCTTFSFNDLLINGNLAYLESWCRLVEEKRLPIRWVGQALARPDMHEQLFGKMKEAGCTALQFGIESGSDRILKRMGKLFSRADAEKVLRLSAQAGINNWVNLIVGFPGETESDFQETVSFVRSNRRSISRVGSVNTCNVVFNSGLMNNLNEYGVVLSDNPEMIEVSWSSSDGNCNALRKDRAHRLVSVLNELEIPIGQTNLFVL